MPHPNSSAAPGHAAPGQAALALTFVLLVSLLASLNEIRRPGYLALDRQTDFQVYFSAAALLRDHLSPHLYDEADTGVDPQLRDATPNSAIARAARRAGVSRVKLYLYPPLLADLLGPLTRLSATSAARVWRALNLALLAVNAALLARLLGWGLRSRHTLLVLAGLLCFSPLWQGLHYGQITIVLLTFWSLGVLAYANGWKRTFACALGLATLLKLTPVIVLLPLVLWRDWRSLRWYAGVVTTGIAALALVNSPAVLWDFFVHVVPPMSGGVISRENQTVLSAVQMLWSHGSGYPGMPIPPRVPRFGRLLSLLLLGSAAWLTWRRRQPAVPEGLPDRDRALTLAAFALLSLCVSPVAWVDSLVIGYPLLVLLWQRALRGESTRSALLFLLAASLCMGGSLGIKWTPGLQRVNLFQYLPLFGSLALVFAALGARGPRPRPATVTSPAAKPAMVAASV